MPTASAIPPSVIELRVSPKRSSTTIETSSESGIETSTISVERKLPRNSSIMMPVSPAAMIASRTTPLMAPLTKIDWSKSGLISSCGGNVACTCGSAERTPETTLSVLAPCALRTGISAPRVPLVSTMLVCGA